MVEAVLLIDLNFFISLAVKLFKVEYLIKLIHRFDRRYVVLPDDDSCDWWVQMLRC